MLTTEIKQCCPAQVWVHSHREQPLDHLGGADTPSAALWAGVHTRGRYVTCDMP